MLFYICNCLENTNDFVKYCTLKSDKQNVKSCPINNYYPHILHKDHVHKEVYDNVFITFCYILSVFCNYHIPVYTFAMKYGRVLLPHACPSVSVCLSVRSAVHHIFVVCSRTLIFHHLKFHALIQYSSQHH